MKIVERMDVLKDDEPENVLEVWAILQNGGSFHFASETKEVVLWDQWGKIQDIGDKSTFKYLLDNGYLVSRGKVDRVHRHFHHQCVEIYAAPYIEEKEASSKQKTHNARLVIRAMTAGIRKRHMKMV